MKSGMEKVAETNILRHHDAHPLVLDLAVTKKLGPEWWLWEPETIRTALQRNFQAGPTELNWNKLQAVRTVHVSPGLVFDEWECFLPVITALNNVIPDFNILQLPSPARLYAGVGMLRMLDPEENFSEEVKRFIAASLLHEGIFFAPGELSFVQWYLNQPYYECTSCGNIEDLLVEHDGICDNCQKNYFVSMTGKVMDSKKKITRVKVRNDITEIKKRFADVAKDWESFHPDEDSPLDVQICRIAAAIEYKIIKDTQFLEQKGDLGL